MLRFKMQVKSEYHYKRIDFINAGKTRPDSREMEIRNREKNIKHVKRNKMWIQREGDIIY